MPREAKAFFTLVAICFSIVAFILTSESVIIKSYFCRLRVRNLEVDSSYSYMQRFMLNSVCNVPVSGESKETKNWLPAFLVEAQK